MDQRLKITSTTAVDPRYLKVKDAEKDRQSHQDLLHHYKHAKISTIYLFNLEIQQILESHDLNSHTYF